MAGRFRHAVLGGTFDRLHAGHEALLGTAFRVGRSVAIGLTSQEYLRRYPKPDRAGILPYAVRRRALERWLRRRYRPSRWRIVPIDDPFGGSVEDGVDALVVSADTVAGGRAVNRERRRRGRAAVPLVVVPLVLADDLTPLSSRRIRRGEVRPDGRLRRPVRVGLTADSPTDLRASEVAVRRAFPGARVRRVAWSGRSPPWTGRLRKAAVRARGARDLGVAVSRAPRGGWRVAVAGPAVSLDPRPIPPGPGRSLEHGLANWLRAPRRPFPDHSDRPGRSR